MTSKEKIREYNKKYNEKNREKINAHQREYRKRDYVRKKEAIYSKKWKDKNREKVNLSARKYNNRPEVKARIVLYLKKRYQEDKLFRIKNRLRVRLYQAIELYLMNGKIMGSSKEINFGAVIKHLKPFPKDLSKYHIDHIKPLCSFKLTDPEEVRKAFAPENHQWLTVGENLSKGGKY